MLTSFLSPAPRKCIAISHIKCEMNTLNANRNKKRTEENSAAADIELTPADLDDVKKVLEENPVKGNRYGAGTDAENHLWG